MKVKLRCKKCSYEFEIELELNPLGSLRPTPRAPKIQIDKDSLDKILKAAKGASREELEKLGIHIEIEEWEDAQDRLALRNFLQDNIRICREKKQMKGEKYVTGIEPWKFGDSFTEVDFTSCFDEETEILTRKGWKKGISLRQADEILTLNPSSQLMEYQKPSRIIIMDYCGPMISFSNWRMNLKVTPNHRMFIARKDWKTGKLKEWKFEEAYKVLGTSFAIKRNGLWKGIDKLTFLLPSCPIWKYKKKKSENKMFPPREIPMETWLKFFGLFLSEGYTGARSYLVGFGNNSEELLNEYRRLLEEMNLGNPIRDRNEIKVYNKQLWTYLRQFGKAKEKFVPLELKNLSSGKLQLLLSYMMKGDGYIDKNRTWHYLTSSQKLKDDVEELALKIGKSFHTIRRQESQINGRIIRQTGPNYQIQILREYLQPCFLSKGNKRRSKNFKEKIEFYKGKIWCVTVPNGVVMVKRNGFPLWSGNSEVKSAGIDDLRLLPELTLQKKIYGITRGEDIEEIKGIKFIVILDGSGSMMTGASFGRGKIAKALLIGKEIYEFTRKLGYEYLLGLFSDKAVRVNKDRLRDFWSDSSVRASYNIWSGGTQLALGLALFTEEEYKDANVVIISDMDLSDFQEVKKKIQELTKLTNTFKIILIEQQSLPSLSTRQEQVEELFPEAVNLKIMYVPIKS